MMLARWLTLMCFIGITAGCLVPPEESVEPQIHLIEKTRPVPAFTQVYIQGPFDVYLHTHKNTPPSLKLLGDYIDLEHVDSYVKRGVLYVSVGPKKGHIGKHHFRAEKVSLEMNVPHLHGFTYKGSGKIDAQNIRSTLLDIWIAGAKKSTWSGWMNLRRLTLIGDGPTTIKGIHSKSLHIKIVGSPDVELEGKANLKRLDIKGDGTFRFYWIKSKNLVIRARGAIRMMLSGTVDRLDGVFSDRVQFDGRYLRAKDAFIKTNDKAVADIAVVENQHALARDTSDIYFHNLPLFRMGFMARNGAILDMRPDEVKLEQHDTPYNH